VRDSASLRWSAGTEAPAAVLAGFGLARLLERELNVPLA
jgi:hypothetical protein